MARPSLEEIFGSTRTQLSEKDESQFRDWYSARAEKTGISADPDAPEHKYDYRAAFKAGSEPDSTGHWPSQFKDEDHPNRFVDGMDTKTGQRQLPLEDIFGQSSREPEIQARKDVFSLKNLTKNLTDFLTGKTPERENAIAQNLYAAFNSDMAESVNKPVQDLTDEDTSEFSFLDFAHEVNKPLPKAAKDAYTIDRLNQRQGKMWWGAIFGDDIKFESVKIADKAITTEMQEHMDQYEGAKEYRQKNPFTHASESAAGMASYMMNAQARGLAGGAVLGLGTYAVTRNPKMTGTAFQVGMGLGAGYYTAQIEGGSIYGDLVRDQEIEVGEDFDKENLKKYGTGAKFVDGVVVAEGVDRDLAKIPAIVGGIINGVIEVAQQALILRMPIAKNLAFSKKLDAINGSPLTKKLLNHFLTKALEDVPQEVLEEYSQALNSEGLKNAAYALDAMVQDRQYMGTKAGEVFEQAGEEAGEAAWGLGVFGIGTQSVKSVAGIPGKRIAAKREEAGRAHRAANMLRATGNERIPTVRELGSADAGLFKVEIPEEKPPEAPEPAKPEVKKEEEAPVKPEKKKKEKVEKASEAKEPWQMTRSEYESQSWFQEKYGATGGANREAALSLHDVAIEDALTSGETVPEKVLSEYLERKTAKEKKTKPKQPPKPPEGKPPEPAQEKKGKKGKKEEVVKKPIKFETAEAPEGAGKNAREILVSQIDQAIMDASKHGVDVASETKGSGIRKTAEYTVTRGDETGAKGVDAEGADRDVKFYLAKAKVPVFIQFNTETATYKILNTPWALNKFKDAILRGVTLKKGSRVTSEMGNVAVLPPIKVKLTETLAEPGEAYGRVEPFYSAVERTARVMLPERGTGTQFLNTIRNAPGVKQDEIEWMGLEEFLKGKDKITKQEVLDFIRANKVEIEEVKKGEQDQDERVKEIEREFETMGWKIEKEMGGDVIVLDSHGLDIQPTLLEEENPKLFNLAAEYGEYTGYDSQWQTKFASYQIPGGENYRELLLTLPSQVQKIKESVKERIEAMGLDMQQASVKSLEEANADPDLVRDFQKIMFPKFAEATGVEPYFRSPHWDEPNVLAHVRVNDRKGPNGEKILFIEEIQSDWHQKGRGEGYQKEEPTPPPEPIKESDIELRFIKGEDYTGPEGNYPGYWESFDKRTGLMITRHAGIMKKESVMDEAVRFSEIDRTSPKPPLPGVPDAPFKKTWHELVLKRILRMAAEEGYDQIAWTTGSMQNERYDLSKQILSITWSKDALPSDPNLKIIKIEPRNAGLIRISVMPDGTVGKDPTASFDREAQSLYGKKLEDVIGKEVAEKILKADEGGLDAKGLQIGGEGMKGFYDLIIPSFLNKYTKKWGGRVSTSKIKTDNAPKEVIDQYADQPEHPFTKRQFADVPSLAITPSMKTSVLGGQALFEPRGQYYLLNPEKDATLPSEKEVAYGSEEKAEKAIQEVISEIEAKHSPQNVQRARVVRDLKKVKFVNYAGRKIDGPDTLAQLHQVFRSPSVENLVIYVLKPDGTVFSNRLTSSGLVDQSVVTEEVWDYLLADLSEVGEGAKFYMAHNHPSGRMEFSPDDNKLTRKFVQTFTKAFAGHLVIDHGKYLFYSEKGEQLTGDYEIAKARDRWLDKLLKIGGPGGFAGLFSEVLRGANHLHVHFLDKGNNSVSVEILNPFALGAKLAKIIADAKKRYAASSYVIIGDDKTVQSLKETKMDYPVGLLDVIKVFPDMNYESGKEQGNLPASIMEGSVVFEPGSEYGKSQEPDAFHRENDSPEKNAERRNWDLSEKSKAIIRKYAERVGEQYVPRGNLGVFFGKSKNIFVKALNDISTVTHEVTHYLDRKYNFTRKIIESTGHGDKTRKEITRLYVNLYGKGKRTHPLKKRITEGLATLIENYAMNPDAIKSEYPDLVSLFITPGGKYHVKEIGELIKDIHQLLAESRDLGPMGRFDARVSNKRNKHATKSYFGLQDMIKSFFKDDLWRIEKLEQMQGVSGKESPTNWTRVMRNVGAMVFRNIHAGNGFWSWREGDYTKVYDFNWGDLIERTQANGTSKTFGNWLVARRQFFMWQRLSETPNMIKELQIQLEQMMGQGDPEAIEGAKALADQIKALNDSSSSLADVLSKDKFDRDDSTAVYMMFKDDFKEEAKMFDALVRADLEMLADPEVMLLTQEQKDRMVENEGYATYHRDIYNEVIGEDVASLGGPKRMAQKASFLKERYGSELDILNPIYGQLLNHAEALKKAMRQTVYNKLLKLAPQFPELFQQVPLKVMPQPGGGLHFPQMSDSNIFMARENYQRKPVVTDKNIKLLLDNVLMPKNFDFFARILLGFKRIFTVGTTSAYPPFAIVNFGRDQVTASFLSVNKKFIPFYDSARALGAIIAENDTDEAKYVEEYFALGGERQTLAGIFDKEPQEVLEIISNEVNGNKNVIKLLEQGVHMASIPAQYSEYATRLAEYIKSRQAGKPAIQALEDAGRVSGAFHHYGDWGDSAFLVTLFKMVPFANANLQVTWQMLERAADKDPKFRTRAITVLAAVTAAVLGGFASTLMFGDDDDREQYKNILPQDIARAIYFPNPFGKGLLSFPIPEELGVFGALMNAAMSQYFLKTEYTGKEFFDLATTWIPDQFNLFDPIKFIASWIPQPVSPLFSFAFNVKTFPEVGPIDRYPKYAGADKYKYASNVAVSLGKLMDVSPYKIDYLIRGYLTRSIKFIPGLGPGDKGYLANFVDMFKGGILREYYFNAGRNIRNYYEIRENNQKMWSALKNKEVDLTEEEIKKLAWNRAILNVNPVTGAPGINKLMTGYRAMDVRDMESESPEAKKIRQAISFKIALLKK